MLRSLRARLVLFSVCLTAAGLALCSGAIHMVVRRELVAHVDEVLVAQAGTIASLVEYDGRRGAYEFLGRDLLEAEGDALRVQVLSPSGAVLAMSAGGIPQDPEHPLFDPAGRPHAWSWATAIGERWRGVICAGRCTKDDEDRTASADLRVIVRIARRSEALDRRLERIALLLGGLTVGLSLVVGAALGWGIGRALRPLDAIAQRIAGWNAERISDRLPVPAHPAELVPVVTTLNQLLSRIEASLRRERAIGSAIAHEVRTPLAGLRMVVEVSLSQARSADAGRAALGECLVMVGHLQALVESLLLLTRLEQGHVPLHPVAIDLAALVRGQWAPFAARAAQRGLAIGWDADGACPLTTDAELLVVVVRNLLDNAVDHADPGGSLAIAVTTIDGRPRLSVGNTCTTLAAADAPRVFERFWRGDQARSVDDRHCGLGLCLSRDIAQALGGRLDADLCAGSFTVVLELVAAP